MHCTSSGGRPNTIQVRNSAHVEPVVTPRTIGNRLLAEALTSHVTLARLPQHCDAQRVWCRERVNWRVEWRSVVFSDENRFSLYASDGRTSVQRRFGERHLRSTFFHDTQAPP